MRRDTMYRTLVQTVQDCDNPHYGRPHVRMHIESGKLYTARVSESYYWQGPPRQVVLDLTFSEEVTVGIKDCAVKTGVEVTVDIIAVYGRLVMDTLNDDGVPVEDGEEEVWIEATDLRQFVDDVKLGAVDGVERIINRLRDSLLT